MSAVTGQKKHKIFDNRPRPLAARVYGGVEEGAIPELPDPAVDARDCLPLPYVDKGRLRQEVAVMARPSKKPAAKSVDAPSSDCWYNTYMMNSG